MKLDTFFDELIDQTNRRGGYPSSGDIADVSLRVSNVIELYSELRAKLVVAGFSESINFSIEEMDHAILSLSTLE